MNPNGLPGPGTATANAFRQFLTSIDGRVLKPGGTTIQGANSRDPGNTGYVDTLRAGLLMGKITTGGRYAPSIIGG